MQDSKRRSVVKRASREVGQIPAVGEQLKKSDYPDYINRCAKPRPRISRSHLSRCVRLLKASRQRLKSESAWTKGTLARDVDGKTTSVTDRGAVRWCLIGTLKRTQRDLKLSDHCVRTCQAVLFFFINTEKFKSIIGFNDALTTRHAKVLSLLTLGISALKLRLLTHNARSHVDYIQRGRGTIEKIISHRQQKKESQES